MDMRGVLWFIILLCIPAACSSSVMTGDWLYRVNISTNVTGIFDASATLAGQSVGAVSGDIDAGGTETDTFDILVNLVTTDLVCDATVETSPGGYGSGYLTVPNEALNAISLAGRVDWSYEPGTVAADVHVLSYTLEDNPNLGLGDSTDLPSTVPPLGGKIPVVVYITLVVILFLVIFYIFSDLDNRLYAPVALCLVASLLAFMLAIMSVNGSVADTMEPLLVNQTLVNNSTTFQYEPVTVEFHSGALGWFFALIGIFMTILTVYLAAEAFWEHKRQIDTGDIDDY